MTLTNGYTTLALIKARLSITSTDSTDDGVIESLVEQASRLIDAQTGRTFYARTETHYYDKPIGDTLEIYSDDLLTVTTLTNGDASVIASASYKLYPLNTAPKWQIRLLDSSGIDWQPNASGDHEGVITVAGTWGYASSAPADIAGACEEMVIRAYRSRSGVNMTEISNVTAAGVVITPQGIPTTAWEVIRYYRRLV
jgi:hypothetical protein